MLTVLLALSALARPLEASPPLDGLVHLRQRALEARPPAAGVTHAAERAVRFAGGARVRIDAHIDGLPVVGDAAVVAVSASGAVRHHGAAVARVDRSSVRVSDIEAEAAAHHAVAAWAEPTETQRATAVWWNRAGQAERAWQVDVGSRGAVPHRWRVTVSASDARILALQRTSRTAEAIVYDPSPALAQAQRVDLAMPDLLGPYVDARSCTAVGDGTLFDLGVCGAWSRQARPDEDGDYLFPPRHDASHDPFAEVQAAVHADRMLAWLDHRFELSLPYAPVDTFVNFPTANAFYGDFDGDGTPDISFGHDPASGTDLAYDADVVYHELGHAVVDYLAPSLPFVQADEHGMSWVSGSIHEGAADVFAIALTGDPTVGEHAGAAFGKGAIRDVERPRVCPDHLRGEVHHDGEVLGAFGWALHEDPNVGANRLAELLLGAIPLWGSDVSWASVAASLRWSAEDLAAAGVLTQAGLQAVDEALVRSGMEGCERLVPMDGRGTRTFYLLAVGADEPLNRIPANVQLVVEGSGPWMMEETERRGRLAWSVFGRRGAPVEHEVLELAGIAVAVPTVYDFVVDADDGQAIIDDDGGEGPLHLLVAGRNDGSLPTLAFELGVLTVALEPHRSPGPTTAVAAPSPEPVDPGMACGCQSAPAGLGWLVLLPVVGARRGRYIGRRGGHTRRGAPRRP